MNPIRLELTPEQFAALGGHIPGVRNVLSPLAAGGATDPGMDQQLTQAGLLDANSHVKEPFGSLLSALGKTDVMLDLRWTEAGEPKGFSLYSPKTLDDSNPWAPTWMEETGAGGVVLRSPFTRPDLDAELERFLEAGEASTPPLEIGLTAPQAVVLSVLMDAQRPQDEMERSTGTEVQPLACDVTWILMCLKGTQSPDKCRKYFSVPVQALLPAMEWNPDSVLHVLNSLVRMGLCTQRDTSDFCLAEPMRKLLAGFVGTGKIFWLSSLRSGGENDELAEAETEQIGFCASGMNLVFSWSNGNFQLKTFSSAEFTGGITKEIFPLVVSPVQRPAAPVIRMAAAPLKKKKSPIGLIAGLVAVLLVACVMVVVGLVFLLL